MPGIFISYRRDAAAGHAGRLADALSLRFGHDRVIQDVAISPGADWLEEIRQAIADCAVMLVLIGQRWQAARLDDANDMVRVEIELALARTDLTLVPVLLDGVRVPQSDEIPVSLTPLLRRQAAALRSDRWQHDVDALMVSIEPSVTAPERSSASQGPSPSLSAELPPTNLPVPRDSFVGRGDDLATYRALIDDGDHRLVTVVGPGGAGKTRFSQELARSLLDHFDGHVYFVDLTKTADPSLVANSITLALKVEAGEPVLEALQELFRDHQVLLLLDNFEHVIDAAPMIDELMRGAAGLRVLTTSQERLSIAGEHVVELPPLSLSEAMDLFLTRANAPVQADEARDLERLCEYLDGLPLAIELVSAYARVTPPRELERMLERSLLDLPTDRRNVPERHRSLRAAMAWSHSRLTEPEQLLFRQLAAFPGGWTLQTAAAVLQDDPIPDLQTVTVMRSLADKRLVREDADRRWRWRMLRTLREYAMERLEADAAEAARIRRAHATYFLDVAERARAQFVGEAQAEALETFDAERENLTAALSHFVAEAEVEAALRLATALGKLWWSRDYREGWERFETVLGLPCPPSLALLRGRALTAGAPLAIRLGLLEPASRVIEESLGIARRERDSALEADVLMHMALVAMDRGEFASAKDQLEHAQSLVDDEQNMADVLDGLAIVAIEQEDYTSAASMLEESASLYRHTRDAQGEAWVRNDQARLALVLEDDEAAAQHAAAALEIGEAKRDWELVAWARNALGISCARRGDHEEARTHHAESLRRVVLLGDRRPTILAVEGFAALAAEQGHWTRAIRLAAGADAAREEVGIPRTRAESALLEYSLARAREALPTSALAVAAVTGFFLARTVGGRRMLASGGNPLAARLSGISNDRSVILAHTLSGLLIAIAAIITVAALDNVNTSIGGDWLLASFAAPIIGGVALIGGSVSVTGMVLAAVIVRLVDTGGAEFLLDPSWVNFVVGTVVLGTVLLGRIRESRGARATGASA